MLPKITLPVFEFAVPSTKKKVKLKPMLVRDEKILLVAKQSAEKWQIMMAVKQVVNNCIADEKFDIDKLTIFDLEYLFLKLRAISVSNLARVSYSDGEDQKTYDFDINLDDVEVQFPENIPDNNISVTADILLEITWPSISVYTSKEIYEAPEEQMFDLLVNSAVSKVKSKDKEYDWKTATDEERVAFISDLPAKVADQIRAYFDAMPSLYHEIKYTNEKGTERKITLRTLEDFFTL